MKPDVVEYNGVMMESFWVGLCLRNNQIAYLSEIGMNFFFPSKRNPIITRTDIRDGVPLWCASISSSPGCCCGTIIPVMGYAGIHDSIMRRFLGLTEAFHFSFHKNRDQRYSLGRIRGLRESFFPGDKGTVAVKSYV